MLVLLLIILFIALCLFKLYQKLTCGICKTNVHLVGKVAIVTGANTGIGYETAKDFAERGARVILACRNDNRGTEARDKIIQETGNKDVVYKRMDLSSLASVRAFAEDVLKTEKRLDILVNNAGAGGLGNIKTVDGLRSGMQVNYFGPYLLTRMLLKLLKSSAPSRIVNVSSVMQKYGDIDLEDVNMEKNWHDWKEYMNSKLCNVLMSIEISRQLRGTGVVSNSLHPGVVATEIMRKIPNKVILNTLNFMMNLLYKSPWEGAQTSIYVAVDPALATVTGKHFSDCREKKLNAAALESLARKLWDVTAKFVKFD